MPDQVKKMRKAELAELAEKALRDREQKRLRNAEYRERQKQSGRRRLAVYVPVEAYEEVMTAVKQIVAKYEK